MPDMCFHFMLMMPSTDIVLASSRKEHNFPFYLGWYLSRWDKTKRAWHHLLHNKIPTGEFLRLEEQD